MLDGTIFTVTSDASNGSASIDASSGAWTYTPNQHYNGSDSFVVTITDDDDHTETQIIALTVNPVDDAATIGGDVSGSGNEDTTQTGTITATDAADGLTDNTYFTITSNPSNGSASIDEASGAWTYSPNQDYNGSDAFTVTVTDDDGHTATQIVSLTVPAVDDAAVISGDTSGSGDENATITGTLTATDSADGLTDNTYFTVTSNPSNGSASIDESSGAWSYTPSTDYNGSDAFTVTITDDDGHTATQVISLTINIVDSAAVFGGDISGTGDEDTDLSGTLTVTDSDGLTDGTYFTVTSNPTNGSASIDVASGAWTYTPNADYNGSDAFTVTVTDDDGGTSTQIISLTINPVSNDLL